MKNHFILFVSVFVLTMTGCSKDEEAGQIINPQDLSFVYMSSQANAAEIVLGQLAADSATTPAIQAFGQKMVTEHGTADAGLKTLASELNIPAPATLDQEHEELRTQLLTLKGREFDSLYIYTRVNDYIKAINLFENSHGIGNNTAIKDYIVSALPHLQDRLGEAKQLAQGF